MKISDDELLQLVWLQQLRRLAGGVVCRYMGGKYGLHKDQEFYFRSSSSIARGARETVTTVLSRGQLLLRLRKLGASGRLWLHPEYGDFMLDTPAARAAYEAARMFWVMEGVMEYPHQPARLPADKFERLRSECEQLLLAKFSGAQQVAA